MGVLDVWRRFWGGLVLKNHSETRAYFSLIAFAAFFPTIAYLHGIHPRNDSLNRFDNVVFFARFVNTENQIPIWTTLNFGGFTSLENIGMRPEDILSVIINRFLNFESTILLVYIVIFLATLIMNLCFASVCKDLGIQRQRVILALVLILDFTSFPMTQYWLYFLVIFYTVVLMRIYLSLGMYPLRNNFSLLIPISFIFWGGYGLILPAIALIPFILLGLQRRSKIDRKVKDFSERFVWIGFLTVSVLSLLTLASFILLYLSESKVNSPGRSSSGFATLDSYLSSAGAGITKYFELLGAPTIWQDTHLVVSPLFIPLLIGFMIFRFRYLASSVKKDFVIILATCAWVILLTLPLKFLSTVIFNLFPILRLTRYPGFQMSILIPILLLILGLIFSSKINHPLINEVFPRHKNNSQKSRNRRLIKTDIHFENSIRQITRMHLFVWLSILILYISDYLPYPLIWTRVFFGHALNPYVLLLMAGMFLLLSDSLNISRSYQEDTRTYRKNFSFFKLRILFASLSSVIIFSLGIFQMYFLSFIDVRQVSEFKSSINQSLIDKNFLARIEVRKKLQGQVLDWKELSKNQQEALVSETRRQQLGYGLEPVPMRLIDSNGDSKFRIKAFQEFTSKTFFDEVLNEKTPLELSDPLVSERSKLRKSAEFTTNVVSTSAYALNEDYCPALGIVLAVSKALDRTSIDLLNQSGADSHQNCFGKKFNFLDSSGKPAEDWIQSSALSIGNGNAEIKFVVKDAFIGQSINLVYRDSYSKFWKLRINGSDYKLQSTSDGFKLISYTLRETLNIISLDLGFPLKMLANTRLILDPLSYLGMCYFLLCSLREGRPTKFSRAKV